MSTSAQDLTTTLFCRQPGCENEVRGRVGTGSYCPEHRSKATPPLSTSSAGRADALERLMKQAKTVDRLRVKAARLTEQALAAKRDADAAEHAYVEQLRAATTTATREDT